MNSVSLLPYIQLLVGIGTLGTMIFALAKFLNKPHMSLERRVTELEVKQKEISESLYKGNDKFRDQEEMNEMFISCMLSFINFEIAYCIHTGYEHDKDLIKAKESLEKYLAKR